MRKVPFLMCATLSFSIFACSSPQPFADLKAAGRRTEKYDRDLSFAEVKEKSASESFLLFVHAYWCSHCKKALPLAEAYLDKEDEFHRTDVAYVPAQGFYLDYDELKKGEVKELFDWIQPGLRTGDASLIKGKILIPLVAGVKGGKIVYARTGFGEEKSAVYENLTDIKNRVYGDSTNRR